MNSFIGLNMCLNAYIQTVQYSASGGNNCNTSTVGLAEIGNEFSHMCIDGTCTFACSGFERIN